MSLSAASPPASVSSRVAIVTGASSGIGRATVRLLSKTMGGVCATGRNEEELKKLQKEVGEEKMAIFVVDLAKDTEKATKSLVNFAVETFGRLDVLVNNAGVLQGGAFGSIDLENFDYNMTVNSRVPYALMCSAIPFLKEAAAKDKPQTACIINVTSVNGMQSFGGVAAYCASKAALNMLTKCAAVDLAPDGIRVNAVCPGVVKTELQKRGGMTDETYEAFVKRSTDVTHPISQFTGDICQPEEVADAIEFLSRANYVTGEEFIIDGGRSKCGLR